MWVLTPLFMVILGLINTGLLMIGTIWLDKFPKDTEGYDNIFAQMLRAIFFTVFVYWAVLIIDSIVKILFTGVLGYANFSYHITALILGFVLAITVIIGTAFTAPTIKSILSFIGVAGYSIYYLNVVANEPGSGELEMIYKPLIWNIAIVVGINVLLLLMEQINGKKFDLLWDHREKFKRYVNMKYYIIIFLLFSAELIMKFEGLSLLYWLF